MYSSRTSMKNWAPTNLANILSNQKILNQVLRKGKIFFLKSYNCLIFDSQLHLSCQLIYCLHKLSNHFLMNFR